MHGGIKRQSGMPGHMDRTKKDSMEIKSLASVGFDTIFTAFAGAFADYEMQLDRVQLRKMLKRRGFDPDLSFAAFEGERIVAFTFNGIGRFDGIPTAYDTGTGTLQEYRGRGLATAIFEHSIPYLREAGIGQYLLEVLQHNTRAVSVYRNLGFEVTREFNYFIQAKNALSVPEKKPVFPCVVRPIRLAAYGSLADFWDFEPAWQNSFAAIERSPEDFITLGLFTEEQLIGYCVFEPASGDVTQLAVDKRYRRKSAGSLLLQEMLRVTGSG